MYMHSNRAYGSMFLFFQLPLPDLKKKEKKKEDFFEVILKCM